MAAGKTLESILNTASKVRIMRLFISRKRGFIASGRQVARLVNLTAPSAHAALKELYKQGILKRNIIGRQHIYRLADNDIFVERIFKPLFQKEALLEIAKTTE